MSADPYGPYTTPAGKTRLRRLPPGELARRVRSVCRAWVLGEHPDVEAPLTVWKLTKLTEAAFDRPVSSAGVQRILLQMAEMGAVVLDEKPLAFVSFTPAVTDPGFVVLEARWRERKAQLRYLEANPQYEPGDVDAEWTDAEVYEA